MPVVQDVAGRGVGIAQAVVETGIEEGGIPRKEDLIPAVIGGALDGSGGPVIQHHSASN